VNSMKPLQIAAIALGLCLVLYFSYFHLQYFGDVTFLGAILLLEVIIAGVWRYEQRFFVLLIIAFLWSGLNVPMQGAWTGGRWVVLMAGTVVGFVLWTRSLPRPFRTLHMFAFFCICAALISATVSSFFQMAVSKALSLLLLFVYGATGARLAVVGREDRFFRGLLLGTEIAVYCTAISSLALGQAIWGNPNSLGAAMSIGAFPVLLWGWLNSDRPLEKGRRLVALLLCAYLIRFSLARAAMASAAIVTVVFFLSLKQYRLMLKTTALLLAVVAISGMLAPASLGNQLASFEDDFLYKGHKQEGILGSRRAPWDDAIASIKVHPWFGTGYGTSPTGEDPGLGPGRFSSSAEEEREHGSSYVTIAEWVGLVGVLPFVGLLSATISSVWKVCVWMRRTADSKHYSIPLAMVVLSGLVHAGFEDWLFAVGSYLALFFWFCAFVLSDFVPDVAMSPASSAFSRAPHPLAPFEAVASHR
jgi:O-antigen ligase